MALEEDGVREDDVVVKTPVPGEKVVEPIRDTRTLQEKANEGVSYYGDRNFVVGCTLVPSLVDVPEGLIPKDERLVSRGIDLNALNSAGAKFNLSFGSSSGRTVENLTTSAPVYIFIEHGNRPSVQVEKLKADELIKLAKQRIRDQLSVTCKGQVGVGYFLKRKQDESVTDWMARLESSRESRKIVEIVQVKLTGKGQAEVKPIIDEAEIDRIIVDLLTQRDCVDPRWDGSGYRRDDSLF